MVVVKGISTEDEYKKKNVKKEDTDILMEWLKHQKHLPHEYIGELDIILAHHSCMCDLEVTKRVIDLNFTLRTQFAFYQDRAIDDKLRAALETWLITPLTTLTNKGYTTIYCQLLDAEPSKFVYADVVKAFIMIMDLWQCEEGTVPGVAIILNLDRVSLGHIAKVNLTVAQQFFYFLQEAMFLRLKEFHFINAPSFIDKLMSMFKPFMKEEMLNILKIHKVGSCTLQEYIAYEALPCVSGGYNRDATSLAEETWRKIQVNKTFYEEELKKRVDESKRPGGPKTLSNFFPGLENNFKNLEID